MIIGIDPGIRGALALMEFGKHVEIVDMPTSKTPSDKLEVSAAGLAQVLRRWNESNLIEFAIVERVQAMPRDPKATRCRACGEVPARMPSSSAFSFGKGFGTVLGVLAALDISAALVMPAQWKRAAGMIKKPKGYSITVAQQLWPSAPITKLAHSGRADALLIGRFGLPSLL